MPKALKNLSPDELKAKFIDLSILQSEFYGLGKVGKANKAFDRSYKIATQLRLLPDFGEAILNEATEHSNEEVQLSAAFLLIPIDPVLALKTFRKFVNHDSPWISSSAEICISGWRAGTMEVNRYIKKYMPDNQLPKQFNEDPISRKSYWLAFFTSLWK